MQILDTEQRAPYGPEAAPCADEPTLIVQNENPPRIDEPRDVTKDADVPRWQVVNERNVVNNPCRAANI